MLVWLGAKVHTVEGGTQKYRTGGKEDPVGMEWNLRYHF